MTHPQPEKNNFKEIDVSNLDAITWLRTIESNSVDLVITDPPLPDSRIVNHPAINGLRFFQMKDLKS